jgi:thiol-disulfide isomerase/thioredoxin
VTSRRAWLVGGVGLAAAAAGAGLAWQRLKPARDVADDLWSMKFARPEGGEFVMADLRGSPLIINFWATWCVPCIRELPALQRFRREYEGGGWRVLALAVDSPVPVLEFVAKFKLELPVAMAGIGGLELMRDLGNQQGGLPFSVVLGRNGRVRERKLGETKYDELLRWAAAGVN